jgi:hypothetical protein
MRPSLQGITWVECCGTNEENYKGDLCLMDNLENLLRDFIFTQWWLILYMF